MERTVKLGEQEYTLKASALIPRLYRFKFGRDLIADMAALSKSYKRVADSEDNSEVFSALDLTVFENIAWLMCKHGGSTEAENPDEWLDSIDGVFSIYDVLPVILELWGANLHQTSVPRKK